MGLFFTHHILERLSQRNITKEAIEHILQNPEKKYIKKKQLIYEGVFNNQPLRVITRKRKQHFILITAYYL